MPIKIPSTLPASQILESENIFVMDTERAYTQDIRPLKILILNLMPNKTVTETQLLRLLGNTPLQIISAKFSKLCLINLFSIYIKSPSINLIDLLIFPIFFYF